LSIHPSDGAGGGFSTCSQLFAALPVKAGAIIESLALRSHATQALVLFMTSALIAVALVTPQSSMAAGVELASAVLCGAPLVTLDRRALDATEPGVARTIERFSLNDHRAVGRVPSLWQRVSRRRTLMPRFGLARGPRRCQVQLGRTGGGPEQIRQVLLDA
jgi:hypothetical protein